MQGQIGLGQDGRSVLGPFGQFQAGGREQISKPRVFPFARVGKAIEIKMPDSQAIGRLMRFDHGVTGALDAPTDTQGTQQVAYKAGFASAQVAVQLDIGIAQGWQSRQALGQGSGVVFAVPPQSEGLGRRFYNGVVSGHVAPIDPEALLDSVRQWARELGFSHIGVAGVDLTDAEPGLQQWLEAGFHGSMNYMAAHGLKRARPAELVPGTVSVITARMDYLPADTAADWQTSELQRLQRPQEGIISVYARGRDYHKVLRSRLQKLQARLAEAIGPFGHRVFTDSAPVLEVELATRSGQGWRGKHTLMLSREGGSMFFLGEIFVDLALPSTEPTGAHCGQCTACITACPTGAIVAPYRLDARRCISYLTIEHRGSIDEELRPLMGNRIYGCDDCQLVCPWNKYAGRASLPDFDPRDGLTGGDLVELFAWSEEQFLKRTEGSPIRRIGHEMWLRNIAVALGNALNSLSADDPGRAGLLQALRTRINHPSPLVREHVQWALERGGEQGMQDRHGQLIHPQVGG